MRRYSNRSCSFLQKAARKINFFIVAEAILNWWIMHIYTQWLTEIFECCLRSTRLLKTNVRCLLTRVELIAASERSVPVVGTSARAPSKNRTGPTPQERHSSAPAHTVNRIPSEIKNLILNFRNPRQRFFKQHILDSVDARGAARGAAFESRLDLAFFNGGCIFAEINQCSTG